MNYTLTHRYTHANALAGLEKSAQNHFAKIQSKNRAENALRKKKREYILHIYVCLCACVYLHNFIYLFIYFPKFSAHTFLYRACMPWFNLWLVCCPFLIWYGMIWHAVTNAQKIILIFLMYILCFFFSFLVCDTWFNLLTYNATRCVVHTLQHIYLPPTTAFFFLYWNDSQYYFIPICVAFCHLFSQFKIKCIKICKRRHHCFL